MLAALVVLVTIAFSIWLSKPVAFGRAATVEDSQQEVASLAEEAQQVSGLRCVA